MTGEASILHADLDSFFASVEQRDRPRAPRQAGARRRLGRPRGELRGQGAAASARRWAAGSRGASAPERSSCEPRMSAYAEASKDVYRVFDDTTPIVEGLSIDEAFLDVHSLRRIAGRRCEIADAAARRGARAGRAADHGRDRADEVPGEGGERGREARRAPPRAAGPRARVPPPAPGRAPLGCRPGDRAQAPRPSGSRPWGRSRGSPRTRSSRCSGGRPGGTCTRSRTTTTRGRCGARRAPRLDRRPAGARPLAAGRSTTSTPRSSAWSTASRAGCAWRGRSGRTVVLRLRFDDFSRATRSHTLPYATANTDAILTTARDLLAVAAPIIERRGLTLVGISVANLDDGRAVQLALPFDRRGSEALDAALDEVCAALRLARFDPRGAPRPRPGRRDAAAARLAASEPPSTCARPSRGLRPAGSAARAGRQPRAELLLGGPG